jgi:branched-subunit amino acid transport protein
MTTAWTTVAALAVGTAAIKASGPVALGGRALPATFERLVGLLAPSLIAALVIVQTFATDGALVLDARAAGVAAAAVTAVLRALT